MYAYTEERLAARYSELGSVTTNPEPGKPQEGSMATRTASIALDGTSEHGLWRVILASSVGTMIEWYDFYIFGSLAAVLSLKFYPPGNDTFAYIAYLATFAVGFLVRPFGASSQRPACS